MLAHGVQTRHFCFMMFNYSKNKSKFVIQKKGCTIQGGWGGGLVVSYNLKYVEHVEHEHESVIERW